MGNGCANLRALSNSTRSGSIHCISSCCNATHCSHFSEHHSNSNKYEITPMLPQLHVQQEKKKKKNNTKSKPS